MKIVVLLGLISMMVAYSMAQMPGGAQQQQQSPPNFLQMMLMRNMFDLNWFPMLYYMSAMGGNTGAGGAGASNNLFPLLFLGNM